VGDDIAVVASGLESDDPAARAVVALDASTGQPRWEYRGPSEAQLYTPALVDGRAYVVGHDQRVVALDSASGDVIWEFEAGSEVEALPSVADGILYTAGNDGTALAIDTATGETAWTLPISGIAWAPTVTGGYVLIGTNLGTLYAIGGSGS
jgi:eukaryotic-like serine/threonine-protein kinase